MTSVHDAAYFLAAGVEFPTAGNPIGPRGRDDLLTELRAEIERRKPFIVEKRHVSEPGRCEICGDRWDAPEPRRCPLCVRAALRVREESQAAWTAFGAPAPVTKPKRARGTAARPAPPAPPPPESVSVTALAAWVDRWRAIPRARHPVLQTHCGVCGCVAEHADHPAFLLCMECGRVEVRTATAVAETVERVVRFDSIIECACGPSYGIGDSTLFLRCVATGCGGGSAVCEYCGNRFAVDRTGEGECDHGISKLGMNGL